MSIVAIIPSATYQPGPRTFGPVTIPNGVTEIKVTFTRESWPLTTANVVMQVTIEISVDNGVTYPYGTASQWFGGTRIKRDGSTALVETIGATGFPFGTQRKVRATVTPVAALDTAVTIETQ